MTEYGRIHTDGSRSGGQATQSNIFDACDVQKHTLIVDQDYSSHTVKVKSLDDSQTTQGYGVVTAANYTSPIGGAGTGLQTVVIREGMAACTDRIGGACVVTHGAVGVATQSDALRDQLLHECLVKLRDVQGTEAPKQYACNLIKRIERVLQGQAIRQPQTDALKIAREALQDCVDDLEAEIEAKRGTVLKRTTERDLASVKKGRAALEALGFEIREKKDD